MENEQDEKARARRRGLVMADAHGFDRAISEAAAFYQLQLELTQGLGDPSLLPRFIDGSVAGIWKEPTRYRWHSGGWQPFPPSVGDPGDDPVAMIPDSYDKVWPNWDETWGAWVLSFGAIDPITFDLRSIIDTVQDMIGAVHLDRNQWQPGRMRWDDFREALNSISTDAIENWNAIVETVPSPPPLISNEPYEDTTWPHPVTNVPQSITLYRPESHAIGAQGHPDKFEYAKTQWEFWLLEVFAAHEGLKKAQDSLTANGPLLDAAAACLKMFKRGSQYKFRGK